MVDHKGYDTLSHALISTRNGGSHVAGVILENLGRKVKLQDSQRHQSTIQLSYFCMTIFHGAMKSPASSVYH